MKAKRPLFVAAVLLGLTAGLVSCGEDKTPQVPPKAQQPAQATQTRPGTQQSPLEQEASQAKPESAWLSTGAGDEEITLTENLLARNYYVILDSSGSMGEVKCSGKLTKSAVAKTALSHFAQSVPKDANLGLAVFDGNGISERIPLGLGNMARFAAEVNATTPGDGTPLHDATLLGYHKLAESGRRQAGYGEYHLVIVTDGEANQGQDPTPVINRILDESPILIHTIGFCIGTRHSLNQPGRTIYKAADNPLELRRGLEQVLAESPSFDMTGFKGN